MLGLSGCSGLTGTDGKGYIDGTGKIIRVPPDERGAPVTLAGEDLTGKAVDLADYRGKPVVVNIWGSWCGPCNAEAPRLVAAARGLTDTAKFLGITSREADTAAPLAFDRKFGVPYSSVFDPQGKALLAFRGAKAPTSTPTTIVLDDRGRYAAAITGPVTGEATLVDLVDDVAAGK